MSKNIELKNEITVDEYKAWLTGLLRGKGSALPNLNDWKAIKKMTDKIIPDIVEVQNPYVAPTPYVPFTPVTDDWAPWWENQPTCTTAGQDGDNITISNGSSSIAIAESGSISIASCKSPQDHEFDTSKCTILSAGFTVKKPTEVK